MQEFVKKLKEKLEEQHERCINSYGIVGGNLPAVEVKRCMEIVDQLAEEYNNDFCEWKQEDEEGFSNCRFDYQEIISDEVSGFVYCPYCGKKIKIAPYQPKGE